MGNKLKALWTKVSGEVVDIWEKEKILLIALAAVILTIWFREALIAVIVLMGKRLYNSTKSATDALQKEENNANNQANQLVQDAKNIPDAPTPGDDWNEK